MYLSNSSLNTTSAGDNANACSISQALNPRIAVLWDDYYANDDYILCNGLNIFITSVVGWGTYGAPGSQQFILSWIENPLTTCGTNGATFTVKLFEATGNIEFHYQDTTFGDAGCDDGASATVGIADSSLNSGYSLDVACNTPGGWRRATRSASSRPSRSAGTATWTATTTSLAAATTATTPTPRSTPADPRSAMEPWPGTTTATVSSISWTPTSTPSP